MTTHDLIARCRASIADDKKHGLTYRTCRAEDFEAVVKLAALVEETMAVLKVHNMDEGDEVTAELLARHAALEKPEASAHDAG